MHRAAVAPFTLGRALIHVMTVLVVLFTASVLASDLIHVAAGSVTGQAVASPVFVPAAVVGGWLVMRRVLADRS